MVSYNIIITQLYLVFFIFLLLKILNCFLHNYQCQHVRALDVFFDGIQVDPVEIAVIGCGCSVATAPVAEISHRWNIPQVRLICTL